MNVVDAERDRSASIYHELMDEVKHRIAAINKASYHIRSGVSQADSIFQAEFCFLQIRMICEIVALSSLAAHSATGLSKSSLKEWHAERIFAELLRINPHCFPTAISANRLESGMLSYREGSKFGLQDLRKIYVGCGEMLHRSRGSQIVSRNPKRVDALKIQEWGSALIGLLSDHMIYVVNIKTMFIVSLNVPPDGQVQVVLAEPHLN